MRKGKKTVRQALRLWYRGVRLGPGEQSALFVRGLLTAPVGDARLTAAGQRRMEAGDA